MTIVDWIIYYGTRAVEWLNPILHLVGLGVAGWAFRRCGKRGYLVVAFYFALAAFSLVVMPYVNQAIRARRAPDYSAQAQQKINAAQNEAVQRVLDEEGLPYGVPDQRTINFPFGPMVLVAGLWLVARREVPGAPNGQA